MSVPARVSFVGLGVNDLQASTAFYGALGWEMSNASSEEISFFRTVGGLLMLYGLSALADDVGVTSPPTGEQPFRGVTIAINVESSEAVAAALDAAVAAGATLRRSAHIAEWGGTSGYFADPDGHVWEVAHNPFLALDANGQARLPS